MLDLVALIQLTKNDPVDEHSVFRGVQTDTIHDFCVLHEHQKILAVYWLVCLFTWRHIVSYIVSERSLAPHHAVKLSAALTASWPVMWMAAAAAATAARLCRHLGARAFSAAACAPRLFVGGGGGGRASSGYLSQCFQIPRVHCQPALASPSQISSTERHPPLLLWKWVHIGCKRAASPLRRHCFLNQPQICHSLQLFFFFCGGQLRRSSVCSRDVFQAD